MIRTALVTGLGSLVLILGCVVGAAYLLHAGQQPAASDAPDKVLEAHHHDPHQHREKCIEPHRKVWPDGRSVIGHVEVTPTGQRVPVGQWTWYGAQGKALSQKTYSNPFPDGKCGCCP